MVPGRPRWSWKNRLLNGDGWMDVIKVLQIPVVPNPFLNPDLTKWPTAKRTEWALHFLIYFSGSLGWLRAGVGEHRGPAYSPWATHEFISGAVARWTLIHWIRWQQMAINGQSAEARAALTFLHLAIIYEYLYWVRQVLRQESHWPSCFDSPSNWAPFWDWRTSYWFSPQAPNCSPNGKDHLRSHGERKKWTMWFCAKTNNVKAIIIIRDKWGDLGSWECWKTFPVNQNQCWSIRNLMRRFQGTMMFMKWNKKIIWSLYEFLVGLAIHRYTERCIKVILTVIYMHNYSREIKQSGHTSCFCFGDGTKAALKTQSKHSQFSVKWHTDKMTGPYNL